MSKISHSAWKKYMTCPKMYEYHYLDRLRPTGTSSALVFGSAIDEALNHMLLGGEGYLNTFQQNFLFNDDITWDPRDYDEDILSDDQKEALETKIFEYKSWASMRVKGRLMLEAYEKYVLPRIIKVHSVQREIQGRPGILDAVLEIEGHGVVLIDHKTSARPYKRESVKSDTQLALYAAVEGFDKAGFIVLCKEINKNRVKICKKCGFNGSYSRHKTCPQIIDGSRCHGGWNETLSPEGNIQVIIDDVPQINKDLIMESLKESEAGIIQKVFPRNLSACGKIYGKPCPYIDKCWSNSDNGLEVKEEK